MNERDLDLALDRLGAQHVRRTAPPALRARVLAVPVQTPQRRGWLPRMDQGGLDMFSTLKFAVAGVVLALFGGFLLAGILDQQQSDVVAPAAATESPAATAEEDAVSEEPAPTADVAEASPGPDVASPAPLVAGPGPWLVWERAPELDLDRAELDDHLYGEGDVSPFPEDVAVSGFIEQGGHALGISDGGAFRSDPHGILDGYTPLRLWVMRTDGSIEKHVIDRAYEVEDVAIGPAGILIRTGKANPRYWIEKVALEGRFEKYGLKDAEWELQRDGSIRTNGSGGLPRVIKFGQWRDKLHRIGLRRADLFAPRFWLWRDGEGWSETEAPPEKKRDVLATEDGYFMLGKDGRLHYSADLAGWEVILERGGQQGRELQRLDERVLYVSDDEIAWVGPDGLEPTPFGQAVGEAGPLESLAHSLLLPWPGSDDGLVMIHGGTDGTDSYALFTPDGERWGLAPLAGPTCVGWYPCRLELRDGQLIQYPDPDDRDDDWTYLAYRAVVTDERPG